MRLLGAILVLLAASAPSAEAVRLLVENGHGDVNIRIVYDGQFQARADGPDRKITDADLAVEQTPQQVSVRAQPADGAKLHMHFAVPFGTSIEIREVEGAFRFHGLPSSLAVASGDGAVDITAPWGATRMLLFSEEKAKKLETVGEYKFRHRRGGEFPGANWVIEDRLDEDRVTYGRIRVKARRPASVTLTDIPVPADSPVKLHWEAKPIAERMLTLSRRRPLPSAAPEDASSLNAPEESEENGEFTFTSDVRLVNVNAAVYDAEGAPLTGLSAADFTVLEDGVEQTIDAAESEDAPFNLVILLDYSGSTSGAREKMKQIDMS